jgi:hypothetical protein
VSIIIYFFAKEARRDLCSVPCYVYVSVVDGEMNEWQNLQCFRAICIVSSVITFTWLLVFQYATAPRFAFKNNLIEIDLFSIYLPRSRFLRPMFKRSPPRSVLTTLIDKALIMHVSGAIAPRCSFPKINLTIA